MSIKTERWPEIEFVKEWPKALGGQKPLRAYKAKQEHGTRWFFGFPEEMVKPILPLLLCFVFEFPLMQ